MKIGFFINPNSTLSKKILFWKKKVKNKYGNQLYLNHFPHLTIFTMYVNKNNFENYFNKYLQKNNLLLQKNIILKINKPNIFENDPISKKLILFYDIKKNYELIDLQNSLLKKFVKFKRNKYKKIIFSSKIQQKNYNKFSYPFVGSQFKPHFTISALKETIDSSFIKKFLNQKVSISFKIKDIDVCQIKNNNEHLNLGKIGLK